MGKTTMSAEEVKAKYAELLEDADFERLELGLQAPNIFSILGIRRMEIRHSNFLAWLLNPAETHGLGPDFLKRFLRLAVAGAGGAPLELLDVEAMDLSRVVVHREWGGDSKKRVDLLMVIDHTYGSQEGNLVICIENKVDSRDRENQLDYYAGEVHDRYSGEHDRHLFYYLTPDGERYQNEAQNDWRLLSYRDVIDLLDRLLDLGKASMSYQVAQYISDYRSILKQEITMNDESNVLARKIYQTHRELFDFILDHKLSFEEQLMPGVLDVIREWGYVAHDKSQGKGYAHFLTPALDELVPRRGKGIPGRESFVFELDFYGDKKYALCKALITDGDPEIREQLAEWIKLLPGAETATGKKWITYFKVRWNFDKEKLASDPQALRANLEEQKEAIMAMVSKVETCLLAHKDELLQMRTRKEKK